MSTDVVGAYLGAIALSTVPASLIIIFCHVVTDVEAADGTLPLIGTDSTFQSSINQHARIDVVVLLLSFAILAIFGRAKQ